MDDEQKVIRIHAAGSEQREEEAAAKAGAAEHMLLGALLELYSDASENDVRLGLLRILLQALQRHGEPHLLIRTAGSLLMQYPLLFSHLSRLVSMCLYRLDTEISRMKALISRTRSSKPSHWSLQRVSESSSSLALGKRLFKRALCLQASS